ncbi:hypothetical protein ACFFX0_32515 [Citricoccus parietis]|uniref:Uncharacterized protein n=1 Tax=Citricoccus parietis TaxID=592307 RepID=A0ABV5G9L2_9MICC
MTQTWRRWPSNSASSSRFPSRSPGTGPSAPSGTAGWRHVPQRSPPGTSTTWGTPPCCGSWSNRHRTHGSQPSYPAEATAWVQLQTLEPVSQIGDRCKQRLGVDDRVVERTGA